LFFLNAQKHITMAVSSIRFGIIGCGRIAQRHAEQIKILGQLTAVCDVLPEKADALAHQYSCSAYYTVETFLNAAANIDVVVVCTPNGLHAAHSIAALQAGCHVLCEKPMAINTPDCVNMIAAAKNAGKKIMIVKQNRFNPPVVAVYRLLQQNLLGKIYSIQLNCFWNRNEDYYQTWKGTKELDGGTLFTQFSHFIDLLYWMFGDVKHIQAITINAAHTNSIAFEDTGIVNLVFESGVIGGIHYTVNSYQQNMEGSLTIFAENGTIKIGGQYLNTLEYQRLTNITISDLPQSKAANQYGTYTGSMSNHDKVYENLIDVLTNNATMYTLPEEGLKTVEIIERIYQAANTI
jgi:UDP-N-acetyl-2-amino-2-deoxyglucuronate dehydrogenase